MDLVRSITSHLCTRSLLVFSIGLINSIIPVLILTKQRRDLARYLDGNKDEDSILLSFQPPMSCFGLDIKRHAFGSYILHILSWIDAKAYELSGLVDETILSLSFYGSLITAITFYVLFERLYPTAPAVPADGIMFAIMISFMVGKQMSRFDVIPALEHVDKKLEQSNIVVEQSQAVMEDLLPGFVVESLMNSQTFNKLDDELDLAFESLVKSEDAEFYSEEAGKLLKINQPSSYKDNKRSAHRNKTFASLSVAPTLPPLDKAASWTSQPVHNRAPQSGSLEDFGSVSSRNHAARSSPASKNLREAKRNLQRNTSDASHTSTPQQLSKGLSLTPSLSRALPRATSGVQRQSQRHECVTVFFSDLVGFSTWSHTCDPDLVMATLDDLFSRLDTIIMEEMPGLYKVETVGDAYVVAANLVVKDESHALNAVRFAIRAQYEASQVFEPGTNKPL